MTVTTTGSDVSYAGDDASTVFSFPYKFAQDADLVVELVNDSTGARTPQTLTTHYTVSGAGNPSGGSVTMLTAPATGETLYIKRSTALIQGDDYVNGDGFDADVFEKTLDAAVMRAQDTEREVSKTVTFPPEETGFDRNLPAKAVRVSKVGGFDASGNLAVSGLLSLADLDLLAAVANFNLPGGASSHAALTADSGGAGLVYQRHPFWVPDIAARDAIASPYTGMLVTVDGTPPRTWRWSGSAWVLADGGAASATDNAIVRFDGAGGRLIQNSGNLIDDNDNIAMAGAVNLRAQQSLTSAATTDLGSVHANLIQVTGTTTITSFGTAPAGTFRLVRFAGALTLTHHGTSLILPTAANITTAANDTLVAWSLGSGNWFVSAYHRADGTALAGSGGGEHSRVTTLTPGGTAANELWASLSGTARRIILKCSHVRPSSASNLLLRVTQGGSARSTAGDYSHVRRISDMAATPSPSSTGSPSATEILLANSVDTSQGFSGEIVIDLPNDTSFEKHIRWHGTYEFNGGGPYEVHGAGVFQGNSNALDGTELRAGAGNISGEIEVWTDDPGA